MGIGGRPFGTSDDTGGSGLGINELTGDVTAGPGSGSQVATIGNLKVTTGKIANAAVALAKMENRGANTVIGAIAAGVPVEIPFNSPARDIGAAPTIADVRSVLGIRDIGDFRNWAIAQAKQRLGLSTTQYPEVVIDEGFAQKAGVAPNMYSASYGGVTVAEENIYSGGWTKVTTNGAGAQGGIYLSGFPGPIVNAAAIPWYVAAIMRFPNGVGATTQQAVLELIEKGFGINGPAIGVDIATSPTKFSFLDLTRTAGVPSTVDIDGLPHIFEFWRDPATGDFNGAVDLEGTPLVVPSGVFTYATCPVFQVAGLGPAGAASEMSIGHITAIARLSNGSGPI